MAEHGRSTYDFAAMASVNQELVYWKIGSGEEIFPRGGGRRP
jgi:hypothetical protein